MRRPIFKRLDGPHMNAALQTATSAMNESGPALVVEDEIGIQDYLKIILKRQGYAVLCCGDGYTAEALFEEHSRSVKLVLLDKHLPNFNPLVFCRRLRMRAPDLPIVVQTGGGFESNDELQSYLEIGVAVLKKPYLPDDLWRAVQLASGMGRICP